MKQKKKEKNEIERSHGKNPLSEISGYVMFFQ